MADDFEVYNKMGSAIQRSLDEQSRRSAYPEYLARDPRVSPPPGKVFVRAPTYFPPTQEGKSEELFDRLGKARGAMRDKWERERLLSLGLEKYIGRLVVADCESLRVAKRRMTSSGVRKEYAETDELIDILYKLKQCHVVRKMLELPEGQQRGYALTRSLGKLGFEPPPDVVDTYRRNIDDVGERGDDLL